MKDYEFSRATITEAWAAGLEDVRRSVSGWDKIRPADRSWDCSLPTDRSSAISWAGGHAEKGQSEPMRS